MELHEQGGPLLQGGTQPREAEQMKRLHLRKTDVGWGGALEGRIPHFLIGGGGA